MTRSSFRILFTLLAVLVLGVFVAACGDDEESSSSDTSTPARPRSPPTAARSRPTRRPPTRSQPVDGASSVSLSVGSKNFTEQYVLGEIYAQALKAAGYKIKKDLNLGSELIAYKALRQGEVDAYPEYTGTSLTAFFKVKVKDVPKDPAQAYDAVQGRVREGRHHVAGADAVREHLPAGGSRRRRPPSSATRRRSPTSPAKANTLTVNGFPACRQRIDCLLGVEQTYGFKFKKFLPGEQKYQILDNGDADVAFVFTTDGPLSSGKYVVLEDDKNVFPPYNISFTMRDEVAEKLGQEGQKVITDVQKYMTEEIMQELNARVDLDKQERDKVAADYLKKFGFTS